MDKNNTTITMSLKDYEELDRYVKMYWDLLAHIRKCCFVDEIWHNGARIKIKKFITEDFMRHNVSDKAEFEHIYCKDDIKVEWVV